ncbi:MAG TPA: cobalamin-dependent protein [Thermoanaerobaculia bacterium]|nr:cobalamin-dependent protein [Thermoanaerobaculia bacterium]
MILSAHFIRTHIDDLSVAIADRHFAAHPEVLARYPAIGRQRCLEDARFHLQYLAIALDAGSRELFIDYIGWTKVVLAKRNIPEADLADNLRIVATVLPGHPEALEILDAAIEQLPALADDVPPALDPRAPQWSIASEYLRALLRGSRHDAMQLVTEALDSGVPLRDVYRQVFEPVQQEIGRLWQLNQVSVAQEHFCTAATQHIMTQLYGRIFSGARKEQRAVAMCVGRELHEVGLRIITDLLELDGWQTWYLGASVPPAAAVQLCVDHHADFLLVSATLPPHLAEVMELVRVFRARPELERAKVIVGGRAFRMAPELWRTMGADGYAANADDCLALLDRLTGA